MNLTTEYLTEKQKDIVVKPLKKRDVIQLVAQVQNPRHRAAVIRKWLTLAREGRATFSERDLADFVAADVEENFSDYKVLLDQHVESTALIRYFYDHPTYLARALVRMYPEIFYMEGFAYRFALKLQADLGPVLKKPNRSSDQSDVAVFMSAVPEAVQRDLAILDRERRFREYLYLFSRDPNIGFDQLEEDIARAEDHYSEEILKELHCYCQSLLEMSFPDFVTEMDGSLFPSFHVRWWVDSTRNVQRVLNIGDTGTQKTAYAVVATHHFGCHRVLVLCPPHARNQWTREIKRYFRADDNRTCTIHSRSQISKVASSPAQYTIVGYTTITNVVVRDVLKSAPFDALVWDESQYGKNVVGAGASRRAMACGELIDALPLQYVLALSATPWENHPRELAAVASALRPDLFRDVHALHRTHAFDPRFLRELFAEHVLEAELHEVVDLPPIDPQPWKNLFGVEHIGMNDGHRAVYEFVREHGESPLESQAKVLRLLMTTIHPHCLEGEYKWPQSLRGHFAHPELSTKLMWIKERVTRELKAGAKVVIGTGIYVSGITQPRGQDDQAWIGARLREWFGEDQVLILDGKTSRSTDRAGSTARDRIIQQWRTDPNVRILLVSIRACPDAINLSIPKLPGITKLFLTTLSFPWVPWKQFLGRFWRAGLEVPFSYAVPVLDSTVDESLFRLVQKKWNLQQLFRAQVPLTKRELKLFDRKEFLGLVAPDSWSSVRTVNFTSRRIRECDEQKAQAFLREQNGLNTNGERFAQAFVKVQDHSAPGHIARFMRQVILELENQEVIRPNCILDAGCGPLTLERVLKQPVYGVDMNESILRLGKELSPLGGVNACAGFLTQLPEAWKGKFELTVASLVLHWASLHRRTLRGVPIRLAILQELVRVTHRTGRVWLTFTSRAFTPLLFDTWCSILERNELQVVTELTGLVEAVDHQDSPFAFWSLCFCPEGKLLAKVKDNELTLAFEQDQVVVKRGRRSDKSEVPVGKQPVRHQQFVIKQANGECLIASQAARQAAIAEQERIARLANVPWRALVELRRRQSS